MDSLVIFAVAAFAGWLIYVFAIRNPVARAESTALTCGACGKVIQYDAAQCRHCGVDVAPPRRKRKRKPRRITAPDNVSPDDRSDDTNGVA